MDCSQQDISPQYLGIKKNIVCFRFPTDPIKTCATQIYFMDLKKKKKILFKKIHKMRNDELLAVVKVTEKTLGKGEERVKKTKNSYVMYR